MTILYNKDYYERGLELGISGYSNYRWIPELTIPMAFRLIEVLDLRLGDQVLDFGCAKGYLVKALRLLYRDAYGFDISEYAISQAPIDVRDYIFNELNDNMQFDWIISKDVFEHISYEHIDSVIKSLSVYGKRMFCVIPLAENGRYIVPSYEKDATHIIRETRTWWALKFISNGFYVDKFYYTIPGIKDNYSSWAKGNGFFILRRSPC